MAPSCDRSLTCMIDGCHSDAPSGYKVFRCLYRRHRAPQAHQYRCPGLSLDGAPLALRPPFPSPPSRNPDPNHPSPAATPPCVIPNDPPSSHGIFRQLSVAEGIAFKVHVSAVLTGFFNSCLIEPFSRIRTDGLLSCMSLNLRGTLSWIDVTNNEH